MSELKKLNVDGAVVKPPEDAQATYKTIPETDTEYKAVQNSNMVKENGDNVMDGADEKMLDEEKKLSPKGDLADVKFVTGDQQNGDAKIDILVIKQGFTGLTKEELLKFSNDPFWVRLRWIMFIGFWLLWVGMLAGAIVIIIGAPKCAPPAPKTWWQEGPLLDGESGGHDLDTSPTDLKMLQEKLPLISQLKMKGLFVSPHTSEVDDYAAINSSFTDVSDFKRFAGLAKEKDICLVVDLTPNSMAKSSEWFRRSEQGETPYRDYFIWTDGKGTGGESNNIPNNWHMIDLEDSAWSFSDVRKQYYLHQFNSSTPDLNFRNQDVVSEFSKVIRFWIENGATGIRLSNVKFLLVDPTFTDEGISTSTSQRGAVNGEYHFYDHAKTTYQDGLYDVLAQWKEVVSNSTKGEGLLMMKENLESSESLRQNKSMAVDLPRSSRMLHHAASRVYTADKLQNSMQGTFSLLGDNAWPSWKYASEDGSLSSELGIMAMLLPGVPIVSLDQITNISENKTEVKDQYKTLANMRTLPSMMFGEYNSYLLANKTVFAFSRLKSGNPGVMVLFNPANSVASANLTDIQGIPTEVRVSLLSHNYNVADVIVNGNLQSTNVPISPKSVIIITYVPVKLE